MADVMVRLYVAYPDGYTPRWVAYCRWPNCPKKRRTKEHSVACIIPAIDLTTAIRRVQLHLQMDHQ